MSPLDQPAKSRRRRFRIQSPAHRRVFFQILAIQSAIVVATSVLTLIVAYRIFPSNLPPFFERPASQFYLVGIVMIAGSTITLMSFLFSSRIAGPLDKIRISLEKIRQGEELVKVQVRRDDAFQDIVGMLNQAIDEIGRETKFKPFEGEMDERAA